MNQPLTYEDLSHRILDNQELLTQAQAELNRWQERVRSLTHKLNQLEEDRLQAVADADPQPPT
jgi:uncharacterized coiled-coil protein SlyX